MDPFTDEARRRYISKLYMYPVNDLITLSKALSTIEASEVLKSMGIYRMYSAHDFQIANILYQLNPSFNFTYIKYASQVYFELYREKRAGEMFYVKPIYNGQNFPIKGCSETLLTSYRRDGEVEEVDGLCELSTFLTSLKDVLYTDEADLKEKCYESPAYFYSSYVGKG